jgi:Ca2+-binding RTX toxin-like protein
MLTGTAGNDSVCGQAGDDTLITGTTDKITLRSQLLCCCRPPAAST